MFSYFLNIRKLFQIYIVKIFSKTILDSNNQKDTFHNEFKTSSERVLLIYFSFIIYRFLYNNHIF